MYHEFKPPLVQRDEGLKPMLLGLKWPGLKWLDWETPAVPAGWTKPEFDDRAWIRFPLRRAAVSPYTARICLRSKFRVTEPAKVKGLKLTVGYFGGVVVYLNGQEVARQDVLPAGQANSARPYPDEVFVTSKGAMLPYREVNGAEPERQALRLRTLDAVAIPASALKSGTNVLAIEVIRAPYNKIVATLKPSKGARHPYDLNWNTCHIDRVQLAADSADGLVPNAVRPEGFQVWNTDPIAADFDQDWGDRCEELRPMHLVGARNGAYTGKVGVGSTQPITGLKAVAGDLKGEGGATIPAAAVHLRYGIPWGEETPAMAYASSAWPYPVPAKQLGALNESAPKEVPVCSGVLGHPYCAQTLNQPAPVFGAVTSVWATVKIPVEANPGFYKGEITIQADGVKPVKVPLEVKVIDWTLPDPQNYRTWAEFMQSPETLALEYKLEPWSQRHWAMIAQSFKYLSDTGSRVLYVPVIAHTNMGNDYSMVRWIRKGDGKYDFDFSIMDKYLDTAEKNLGKPKIVCFIVWDIYLVRTEIDGAWDKTASPEAAKRRKETMGKGPVVTVLDPATKKLENVNLPLVTEPGSMEIWKPLFGQLRARLKARGLEDTATLGLLSDGLPTKKEAKFLHDASGGLPWVSHSHHGTQAPGEKTMYWTHVWHNDFPVDTSLFGWQDPRLHAQFQRINATGCTEAQWWMMPEMNITGGQRGVGRLGADFWPLAKGKGGSVRIVGNVTDRYPEASWRNLELINYFLAPGPDGPVVMHRFEAVRQGIQECEARIYIETALTDKALRAKLSDKLTGRIKQTLDERIRYLWASNSSHRFDRYSWGYPTPWGGGGHSGHTWFLSTNWQERSEKLYALAAEAHKRLTGKQTLPGHLLRVRQDDREPRTKR